MFIVLDVSAQSPQDKFYLVDSDLDYPIGQVRSIIADTNHLVWVGANTGLYTYDGYRYTAQTIQQGDEQRAEPEISALKLNQSNNDLWVGHNNGVTIYNIDRKKARSLTLKMNNEPSGFFYISDIFLDKNEAWITTPYGLFLCDGDVGECQLYRVSNDKKAVLNDPYINRLKTIEAHDDPDSLWITSQTGILLFDKKTKKFSSYIPNIQSLTGDRIFTSLVIDEQHLIASTYGQGIVIIDRHTKLLEKIKIPDQYLQENKTHPTINFLEVKSKNELWVGTRRGLFSFSIKEKKFSPYPQASPLSFSTERPIFYTIYKDALQHWWVGFENGMTQWDPARNIFNASHVHDVFQDRTSRTIVDMTHQQNGGLVIAGYKKGIYTRGKNGFFLMPTIDGTSMRKASDIYYAVFLNERNWLITDDRQMWNYNPKSGKSDLLFDAAEYIQSDMHMFLCHDFDEKKNTMWAGLQWGRGLVKIDIDNKSSKKYDQNYFVEDSLAMTTGFGDMVWDGRQYLWFPLGIGFCRFDPDSESTEIFAPSNKNQEIEPTAGANLAQDAKGVMWFSFVEKGLYYFDEAHDKMVKYHFDISNDVRRIGDMKFDREGFLWCTSNIGLLRIDLQRGSSSVFNNLNGLPSNDLIGCFFADIEDQIILHSTDWYAKLDEEKLAVLPKYLMEPSITDIQVRGAKDGPNISDSRIILSHATNAMEITFSALNFKPNNLNRYRYQLKNYSDKIIDLGQQQTIQFNQLRPGKYHLNLWGSFGNENWSHPKKLSIEVVPPWWRSWWAYLSYAILVIGAIWTFNKFKARRIRREESIKAEYEVKLAELKMEALRSQMNPHFIFNALNSIKHFILGNDKFLAAEYLSNFSRLVRKILSNSKATHITLEEELDTLELYLEMEKLRFDNKFEYDIKNDSNVELDSILMPPLILQPYVENAIWHGIMHKSSNGKLLIEIIKEMNYVICRIEDDGIGREKAKELNTKSTLKKKSFGMQITKSRIDMSNIGARSEVIDLVSTDGKACGTQVNIYFPYPQTIQT